MIQYRLSTTRGDQWAIITDEDTARLLAWILQESNDGEAEHKGPFHSYHEAHSVAEEEWDELWDAIKANEGPERIAQEAVQAAALLVRLILELCRAGSKWA